MDDADAPCLDSELPCDACNYGNARRCPVRLDPEYRSYILALRTSRHLFQQEGEARRQRLVEILRRHRAPLHYQMAHRIYMRRYEDLPISDHAVYAILASHPDVEPLGGGVYKVRHANR